MRPIKFRVYDKENKCMIYSSEPKEQGRREYIPFVFGIGWSGWDESWLSDLMQFTGILDSKGKAIYEGDIVHTDNEPIGYEWDEDEDEDHEHYEGVVTYEEGGYVIRQPDKVYTPSIKNIQIVSIEVTGNIHEKQDGDICPQ